MPDSKFLSLVAAKTTARSDDASQAGISVTQPKCSLMEPIVRFARMPSVYGCVPSRDFWLTGLVQTAPPRSPEFRAVHAHTLNAICHLSRGDRDDKTFHERRYIDRARLAARARSSLLLVQAITHRLVSLVCCTIIRQSNLLVTRTLSFTSSCVTSRGDRGLIQRRMSGVTARRTLTTATCN